MRILFAVIILILTLILTGGAHANCFWDLSGRLEGYRPPSAISSGRTWPLENVEMRVQVRWSSGGTWNGPNWPATRTGANGAWSVRSAVAFPDPDCQRDRVVRVQIRGYQTGNNWRTVHTQSVAGPGGMIGLLNPIPTHSRRVGLLVLGGGNESENGIIYVENFGEPPIEWATPPDEPVIEDDPTPGSTHPNTPGGGRTPVATDAPCAHLRSPFAAGVEFRFGQMTAAPSPLSPDQAMSITLRPAGNTPDALNRIEAHAWVENAGSRNYVRDSRCPSMVHFRINEGPGRRGEGDDAWLVYSEKMPSVAVNALAPVSITANFLGTGDWFAGDWEEQWPGGADDPDHYEYVLVEIVLDATRMIMETAEGDNVIQHCYHAPENVFVPMSNCQASP